MLGCRDRRTISIEYKYIYIDIYLIFITAALGRLRRLLKLIKVKQAKATNDEQRRTTPYLHPASPNTRTSPHSSPSTSRHLDYRYSDNNFIRCFVFCRRWR